MILEKFFHAGTNYVAHFKKKFSASNNLKKFEMQATEKKRHYLQKIYIYLLKSVCMKTVTCLS